MPSSRVRDLQDKLEQLSSCKGYGTTLVTLYVPKARSQQDRARTLIKEEQGLTKNIKDRTTGKSVHSALTSVLHKLKDLKPRDFQPHGRAIFCGVDVNTQKMVVDAVAPLQDIPALSYSCGKEFDLGLLRKSFTQHPTYGVVVMGGQGLTVGEVCGERRTITYRQSVQLPKKHSKGGQSAGRFFRTRV